MVSSVDVEKLWNLNEHVILTEAAQVACLVYLPHVTNITFIYFDRKTFDKKFVA